MDFLKAILPNFSEIFHIAFLVVIVYYGWVLFIIGLIYMLWRMYYLEIEHQYIHSQEWIFLNIKVPRENMVSTLAVESIFTQMHALHTGKTFANKYIEGQIQLWYTLEIVSMGGKISFLLRIPAKMKDVVESAFYSHYPQAEISETTDYMENFHYDPDQPGEYDIFGSEWKLTEDAMIPIKTYKDFEHTAAEETIIDPLANFFEGMAKIQPYEMIAYQITIQPLSDEDWKSRADRKVKELTGEEMPHSASFLSFLMAPFNWFSHFSYSETLFGGHGHGHDDENKPKNNWLSMTEMQKERVNLVEQKAGKPGYSTKIRMLYIAPADKIDMSRKGLMSGLYRPLGSAMRNKLKPDMSNTWIGVDEAFSKTLEKPYLDWLLKNKKRKFIKGYKERNIHIGSPMFIMNVEEIATLYHFPITTKTTTAPSAVEKTESKKSQPPVNLPIAGADSGF
ncbi:MAG: hypothetical protein WC794_01080 [Candidatus Doudnabacteria bacterium]|jgi:hypothetical protein